MEEAVCRYTVSRAFGLDCRESGDVPWHVVKLAAPQPAGPGRFASEDEAAAYADRLNRRDMGAWYYTM